jgi:hypothetical protein
MAGAEYKKYLSGIELKGIELLNSSLNLPPAQAKVNEFRYNINLESKADTRNKLYFVVVAVDVKNDDQTIVYGSLIVSCIFQLENFDQVIQFDAENKLNVSQQFIDLVNTISVSTVRGIMFSIFKGTFLHNAFLPIVDAEQLYQKR